MDFAFQYIKENGGIDTEKSYPYEGEDDKCRYNPAYRGATDIGFVDVEAGDENALKSALATQVRSKDMRPFYPNTNMIRAPSASPLMPATRVSSSTTLACTGTRSAAPRTLTTASWLSATVLTRSLARLTGSSRTAGAPPGETRATSRLPGTRRICAEWPLPPATPLFRSR